LREIDKPSDFNQIEQRAKIKMETDLAKRRAQSDLRSWAMTIAADGASPVSTATLKAGLWPALGRLFPAGDARRSGCGGNHWRNPYRLLRRGGS
jgi:hypothetical protein